MEWGTVMQYNYSELNFGHWTAMMTYANMVVDAHQGVFKEAEVMLDNIKAMLQVLNSVSNGEFSSLPIKGDFIEQACHEINLFFDGHQKYLAQSGTTTDWDNILQEILNDSDDV